MTSEVLLKAELINKSFGPTHAVADFSLEIAPGEIRGLIGENGSGKSTFSSIAVGLHKPDSGKLYFKGEEYTPTNTEAAAQKGISLIVQEIGTIAGISVAANIFVNKEQRFTKHGMVISIAYALILASIGGVIGGSKILVISTANTILGRFPANLIIFLVMGGVMYFLQSYSVYGARARAVGGNAVLAESAGISTIDTQSVAIMLAAIYGGIAALLSLSYGTGTSIENGLDTIGTAFQAMLGVFVAGFISKHVNIVFGIFAGILSLNILQTGLVAINLDTNLKNTVTGLFLIILMAVTELRNASNVEKMRREVSIANKQKREQAANQSIG